MTVRLEHALQTKVAGRMALLFFVCAAVPLALLAALTIWRTGDELDARARERLRYEARSVGQDALTRLNGLVQSLDLTARAMSEAGAINDRHPADLTSLFAVIPSAVAVKLGSGTVVPVTGWLRFPDLSADDEQQLDDWGRLIAADPSDASRLLLVVGSASADLPLAAATLDPRWLFGLDDGDSLPPWSAACVEPGRGAVQCSPGATARAAGVAFASVAHAATTIDDPAGDMLAWVSSLSLEAQYGAPEWQFALMRPRGIVRAPLSTFVWNLVTAALLAVMIAGIISVAQVRRQLRPLAALADATSRLARHDFDKPLDVTSGDEFQTLGNAFNQLAGDLKRQFAELEAFNIGTLRTLARAIDAKSPWTAGHSERVTTGAIAIGEDMGLAAEQIEEIRRGGLVHDVGKIATPQDVLDKPGRLTPEEEAILRQHPEKGVHILEPIPSFAAVLPIVGQHHEKWDGSGYPAGLSGERIALTARVVAVADVYDALRSDRPYRNGFTHQRVVDIIREGSGRHFDPVVVEAFLRVEARLAAIDSKPDTGQFTRILQTA